MTRGLAAGLLLVVVAAMPVAAQKAEIVSGPVKVSFNGRMQFQFNTTSVEDEPSSTFETRRVRMAVELTIADWITGMVEPDFAGGRVQLRQAWMGLGFSDGFGVRAGQYKKPFSLIQLTSSSKIPMIERNVRIRGLADAAAAAGVTLPEFDGDALLGEEQLLLEALGYDSYDQGASVYGELGSFGYEAGVFNGNGGNAQDKNGAKTLTARGTYRMAVGKPLTLGAGVSRRDYDDGGETAHGTALEVDVEFGEYRKPGVWLLAEASTGDNLAGSDFRGVQAVAAYYVGRTGKVEGIEPVFRLSWGDPDVDADGDAGLLLTPGLNLHLFGRNKLSINWDWYLPQADAWSTANALRAQIQLYY